MLRYDGPLFLRHRLPPRQRGTIVTGCQRRQDVYNMVHAIISIPSLFSTSNYFSLGFHVCMHSKHSSRTISRAVNVIPVVISTIHFFFFAPGIRGHARDRVPRDFGKERLQR